MRQILEERLRSSCAGSGTAPRETNTDVEHMVAVIGFVIDPLETIPKPLIAIAEI